MVEVDPERRGEHDGDGPREAELVTALLKALPKAIRRHVVPAADWAAKLGHPGTVVVLDNIGRDGEIVRDDSTDPKVNGTRAGLRMLGEDPRFDATALQTVGVKGWDGVALALVV